MVSFSHCDVNVRCERTASALLRSMMLLNSLRDLVTIPGPAAVSQLVRRAAGRTQRIFHAAFLSHCVVEIDDMNACRSRHTRDSSRSRCIVKWWVRIAARRAATLASALVAVAVNP